MTALSRAGKAHLKRAILGQEEALRLHAVCRALRRVDLLQVVLAQALRRSLAKYSELDLEDDFCEAAEAPDVRREQPGPLGGCVLAPGGRGAEASWRATAICYRAMGPGRRSRAVGGGAVMAAPRPPLPAPGTPKNQPLGLLLLVAHRGAGVHGLHFGSPTLLWPSHTWLLPRVLGP